uniref:Ig-like domain-containing protein n=1 Tax=Myripristis murdjan TaxID=586833 RepID=A0A667YQY5_9TELE
MRVCVCVCVCVSNFVCLCLSLFFFLARSVSPTYAAVGDSMTLGCDFTLAPEDLGGIDIEWTTRPGDPVVIWYAGNHRVYDHFERFQGRVQFVSLTPATGNASITISDLRLTDSDTYRCKVEKLPGICSVIIRLDVMETPTKPVCSLEGQRRPRMRYGWSKESGKKIGLDWIGLDAMVDSVQGELSFTITSEDVQGPYVCTAQNLVGSETCTLTLVLKSTLSNVAVSAAATVTVLLMIAIVTTIVFWCRKRKNVEYDGNDIKVDDVPPYRWLPEKSQQAVPKRVVLNNSHVGGSQDDEPGEQQATEV